MEFIQSTKLKDVVLIRPRVFTDDRGGFAMTFLKNKMLENGIDVEWVQENISDTVQKGTIRGLHFQKGADVQAKLVSVVKGKAYVAIVDLRPKSPSYGQWEGYTLSSDTKEQLYVPAGFAHGFQTLEENVTYSYKVSNYYAKESEGGLVWNDSNVGVAWPIQDAFLIDRDKQWPTFAEIDAQGNLFA